MELVEGLLNTLAGGMEIDHIGEIAVFGIIDPLGVDNIRSTCRSLQYGVYVAVLFVGLLCPALAGELDLDSPAAWAILSFFDHYGHFSCLS